MPANKESANKLSKVVEAMRISNIHTLSPSGATDVETNTNFVWKDPTAKCTFCFDEIKKFELKKHILNKHFQFYRPYKCKDCTYTCGDSDIYLQVHLIMTGHDKGVDVVAPQIPRLERLIDLIYVHCRKLCLGDFDNVNEHLTKIKDSASTYGQNPKDNSTKTPTKNGPVTKASKTRCTPAVTTPAKEPAVKTPGRSTATSRRAEIAAMTEVEQPPAKRTKISPAKRPTAKKGRKSNKTVNRKKSRYFKCKQCDCNIHIAERLSHVADCCDEDVDDLDENSPSFDACFGNAEEDFMTDPDISEVEASEGSNSDDSYRLAAWESPSPPAKRWRRFRAPKMQTDSKAKDKNKQQTSDDADEQSARSATLPTAINGRRPSDDTETPDSVPNNLSLQSNDNVSNRSTPQNNPQILKITCDYCSQICENQDLLKSHCLENHAGEFSAFYCSADNCGIKDPSSRRLSDHCRSVHKNLRFMKKSTPTDEQKLKLVELKESLGRKGISLDLASYGVLS